MKPTTLPDYYEVLEVSASASDAVIRAAYKSLVQRYHPDRNPGNAAFAERAAQVIEAYAVLSDPDQRARYDGQRLPAAHTGVSQAAPTANVIRKAQPIKRAESRDANGLLKALVVIGGGIITAVFIYQVTLYIRQDVVQPVGYVPSPEQSGVVIKRIPVLLRDIKVSLVHQELNKTLFIPELGVKVGETNAAVLIKLLHDKKEAIRTELELRLAGASYDALVKPDRERYVQEIILETISDTLNIKRQTIMLEGQDVMLNQPEIAEILLPRGFSVK